MEQSQVRNTVIRRPPVGLVKNQIDPVARKCDLIFKLVQIFRAQARAVADDEAALSLMTVSKRLNARAVAGAERFRALPLRTRPHRVVKILHMPRELSGRVRSG